MPLGIPTVGRRSACIRTRLKRVLPPPGVNWEALARAPRVVAVGETGLDYYRNYASKPAQQNAFSKQLAIAAKSQLP